MNESQIRRALELIKPDNALIEVRVIGQKTHSGYFKNVDNLVKKIAPFQNDNIYFVLNEISAACYDRDQQEQILMSTSKTKTTSDNDISGREWLLIDIDSKRPAGVGATDEEKESSRVVGRKVYKFLRDAGFTEPVIADSGNGTHLLYKIQLANRAEETQIVKDILNVLDMFFSNDKAQIDTAVFNPSRITKLYGTVARKGKNSKDRPHRESSILSAPEVVKFTTVELLKKVSSMLPVPEVKSWENRYGESQFNLNEFISKHHIPVQSVASYQGGRKYLLEHCLFDHSHKGKDAAIFQAQNGAIGYKCFHSSCAGHTWRDVRLMFEPDAYSRKYQPNNFRTTEKPKEAPQLETKEKGAKFLRLPDIKKKDRSKIVSIPSGFIFLDKKIIGFNKGEVSLWSGKNGSGKSSVLNQISLIAAQNKYKTVIFSGELDGTRLKQWIWLQAAGRQFTKPTKYENLFYVPDNTGYLIDAWLKDYISIYNNEYGNNLSNLLSDIEEYLKNNEVDVLILDNLMVLDLLTMDGDDKYDKQKCALYTLSTFSKKHDVHIHVVAHPRKSTGFLRKDDISGSGNISNLVDNIFIVHRVNNDFKKLSAEFFGKGEVEHYFKYDNVIEVCKNRDLGVEDLLVGVYYELESKRFLNDVAENIVFEWQDIEIQQSIPYPMPIKNNDDFLKQKEYMPFTPVSGDLPF